MDQFIVFLCVTCQVLLLRRICHVYAKERGLAAHTDLSITRDVRGGGCKMCTLPPSTQLALRSGSSKLDCKGLKIDPFHNRWAYIAVFGLI